MSPTPDVSVSLVGECPTLLWGLTSEERLRRQLAGAGKVRLQSDSEEAPPGSTVVLLRRDYLFDGRTVRDLLAASAVLVSRDRRDPTPVAAHVPAHLAAATRRVLSGVADTIDAPPPVGVAAITVEDLSSAFVGDLLKSAPPRVLPIRPERKRVLERYLFEDSYKGVTDLVTKWVWPTPARWATRLFAHFHIRPNMVTFISLLLAVSAIFLFARGAYATGLLAAWIMTFLDTVDGKLARVTVDSSFFGHILDHGLDLVHPPLWYIAWGFGLHHAHAHVPNVPLETIFVVIVVGYVAGRLLEAAFGFWLADFSMFSWRPVDSYARLILARRNPNLLLLTSSLLVGRPDIGLVAVTLWTTVCTVFLAARLLMAVRARLGGEPLTPWLADASGDSELAGLAKPFTRRVVTQDGP